jgi:aspartate-semialdehyde dehydrogenase
MSKLRAAIVGATGMAGQQFALALSDHPRFQVDCMVTSRSAQTYAQALRDPDGSSRWTLGVDIPGDMRDVPVIESDTFDARAVDVVFTAVESDVASQLEPRFARTTPTFSTAAAHRYDADTPLIITGVNDAHADLIHAQRSRRGWEGYVLPIPNCTVTGLAITLAPIASAFGLQTVHMVSLQAVSGAGRSPGVRHLDIGDNVVPFIPKEEEKVRRELQKILGVLDAGAIVPHAVDVRCVCTRVPVQDGHTEVVFAQLERPTTTDELQALLRAHRPLAGADLHSAPGTWIHVHDDPFRPQPRLDRERGGGMTTSVGRVTVSPDGRSVQYVLVSHNTKMGAGKGAVLLAERMAERGLL